MECDKNTSNCMDNCRNMRDEGCDRGNAPVEKMMPGMAFVPWQEWEDIYCIEEGIERGTIFAQLDKPWIGRPIK